MDGEASSGGDRSVGIFGVESEDQRIVVVEFRLRDPRVRIGIVAFPTDEVLEGVAVLAGLEDCVDKVPFVGSVIIDDGRRRRRGASTRKIVGVVGFKE